VRGLIDSPLKKYSSERGVQYRCIVEPIRIHDAKGKEISYNGKILFRINHLPVKLSEGDSIISNVSIFPIEHRRNPAGQDYGVWLKRKSIYAKAYTKETITLDHHSSQNPLRPTYIRERIRRGIHNTFSEPSAGLLKSLLLGDRTTLDQDIKESFRKTGTFHFMAISGLHLGILALGLAWLLKWCGFPLRIRAVIIILFSCAFAVLVGFKAPIMRATVMISVYQGAIIFLRKQDTLNTLSLASLIILIIDPFQLFDIGFQLSFIAVLGIVYLTPEISRILLFLETRYKPKSYVSILFDRYPEYLPFYLRTGRKLWRMINSYIFTSITISLAAWIVTAPLLMYYFGSAAPVALLLNIVLFPLIVTLLGIGFILLPFLYFALDIPLLSELFNFLLRGTEKLMALLGEIPGAVLQGWIVSPEKLFFLYIWIFLWITVRRHRKKIKNSTSSFLKHTLTLSRLKYLPFHLLLLCICLLSGELLWPKHTEVVMLDVGHGLCTVVHTASGRTIVYDCGSMSLRSPAQSILAPYLRSRGVRKIDVIIISHANRDHYSGVEELTTLFPTDYILVSTAGIKVFQKRGLSKKFIQNGAKILALDAGDKIQGIEDTAIEFLHPFGNKPIMRKSYSLNDSSLIAKCTFKSKSSSLTLKSCGGKSMNIKVDQEWSILLTGDIEEKGLRELFLQYKNTDILRCDILQVPHHGSNNKLTQKLQEIVQAKAALVSSSKIFHTNKTKSQYSKMGVQVFHSGYNGAVIMREK